jgi:uncharacterized protein YdeI (YjbR/CyaY-like superfamily)
MRTLYLKDRRAWRAWLAKHHNKQTEVWLRYYKKDSGKPRIPYDDAVEEALCFGWIDGMVKRVDDACYGQRFTPRKPGSQWAPSNIRRMRKLKREGKMTAAGLAVYQPERKSQPLPTALPGDLTARFKKQTQAWKNFQAFPPYYRRMTIGWVASARQEVTRLKRLARLVEFSARGERIPLM